jgi:hypothetical protein
MPVMPDSQEIERRRKIMSLRPAQAKLTKPYLKNKIQLQRAEGVAQVVEHLSRM